MTAGLRRTMVIFVLDMLCIAGSFFLALWMRFEFRLGAIPQMYLNEYLKIIGPWIVICLVVFQLFRLYNSIWSFVSIDELFRIILAYGVLLAAGVAYVLILKIDMPRSFYFAGFIMSFMSTTALRFSYRFMRQLMAGISTEKSERDRILMIGAGEAGRQLIREINSNPRLGSRVVCIIDDNPSKRRRYLDGVEIAGGRQEIPDAVKKYQVNKIIFAIPTCDGQDRKEILDICSKTGCRVQAVPGMFQLVNGEVSVSKLRDVELQDLLGRDPIQVNLEEICRYISGKVVMVTGGGGSIGSELCRQIAKSNPEQLIIFDIYENNAYDIQMELRRTHPEYRIIYVKGEDFTNELITAIQEGNVQAFRNKYRMVDLLLLDDVQFIAGKERTQEEFFHTFNALYEAKKQIVLTSDRPPKEINTLEDRMKTRFEWGLLADIQPPDFETRIAIIRDKAVKMGVELPDDVSNYIAENIQANIRQLEGAVKKIKAMHELMGERITVSLAENAIDALRTENPGLNPTPERIMEAVANYFYIPVEQMISQNRSKDVAYPRQMAMYMIRQELEYSFPDIAKIFKRDHTTVMHACNKIEEERKNSRETEDVIKKLHNNIRGDG